MCVCVWPNLKRTKQKKSLKGENLDPNFRVTMEKCVTLVFDFRSYLGLSTFFLPLLPLFLQDVGSVGPIVRLSEAIWFFKVSLNKVARLLWNVSTYFFVVYPQFRLVPTVGTSDRGTTFSSCCKCEKIKKVR